MPHNEVLNKCSIINNLWDLRKFLIKITISFYTFCCTNIFQCKIQGVHYTRSPIDWRKFWFYDHICCLTYYWIVSYNLFNIFWSNFHNYISHVFGNEILILYLTRSIYWYQKYLSTLIDSHKIDKKSSLRVVHPSLTIVTPFWFHEFLIGCC